MSVQFTIPAVTFVPNTENLIPINVTNFTGSAFEIAIESIEAVTITGYEFTQDSLANGFMAAFNNTVLPYGPNKVILAAASATSVMGSGPLFYLKVFVTPEADIATDALKIIYAMQDETVILGTKPNPTPVANSPLDAKPAGRTVEDRLDELTTKIDKILELLK